MLDEQELIRLKELEDSCLTPTGRYKHTADPNELTELAMLLADRDKGDDDSEAPAEEAPAEDTGRVVPEQVGETVIVPSLAEPFVAQGYEYFGTADTMGILMVKGEDVFQLQCPPKPLPPVLFRFCSRSQLLPDFIKDHVKK